MHELILELVRDSREPYALARFPLDDGAMVALFSAGRPRWIAKTADRPAGVRRLRAEARGLGQIEPDANALGVPRLLGWNETPDGDFDAVACLVQSAVPGGHEHLAWNRRDGLAPLPATTLAAGDWIRRFQTRVAPPRALTLGELTDQICGLAAADRRSHPEYAPLLDGLLAVIDRLAARARCEPPAVAVHGDFWAGNILVERPRGRAPLLHVVDWSGFDAGTALDDILTWMAQLRLAGIPPAAPRLERWIRVFFTPGRAREYLRDWKVEAGYSEADARLAFYLHLIRRMSWELGLGLQSRSQFERGRARREWEQVLDWLVQYRYPDPFTPVPV